MKMHIINNIFAWSIFKHIYYNEIEILFADDISATLMYAECAKYIYGKNIEISNWLANAFLLNTLSAHRLHLTGNHCTVMKIR